MQYDKIPLPSHAHVPGLNQRHEEGFLDHVKQLAPEVTLNEQANDNPAWLYGIRLFEHGFFWECHEVLETVWMNALPNSREKHLVQGFIHLANAALKTRMNKQRAAERLSDLADLCFQDAYLGMQTPCLLLLNKTEMSNAVEQVRNGNCDLKFMKYNS